MPRVGMRTQRDIDFDPSDMVVDDLKKECRLRHLPTSGTKTVLVERLRDAIGKDPSLPAHRLTSSSRRKKRISNKREPQREDFATEDEYMQAWNRWREIRDHNNVSALQAPESVSAANRQRLAQLLARLGPNPLAAGPSDAAAFMDANPAKRPK
ncbi:hypothetical protein PTSG_12609 [Salpingoeca rosetta]|uniref:SAP domain-containing protein n=1 Tax=Salpingoeca rosetta (strain ATCC 50818 / BSB-021) TaxID=946362 RepID=F2UH64_SALR5|nr:uncharacterized protein PTSG_12609 [Salpingoeca rosetta]EGD76463.1 hypothetical protein PTSG_12609 [Salpingoeca rosetta]|eukprot:XP_004991378.1 hypothetical protein PTSG_12609 [Salpingoeca rosetta]